MRFFEGNALVSLKYDLGSPFEVSFIKYLLSQPPFVSLIFEVFKFIFSAILGSISVILEAILSGFLRRTCWHCWNSYLTFY